MSFYLEWTDGRRRKGRRRRSRAGTPLSHLRLVRLPADHVEDLEGGGDGTVLVAVHLCKKQANRHRFICIYSSGHYKHTLEEIITPNIFKRHFVPSLWKITNSIRYFIFGNTTTWKTNIRHQIINRKREWNNITTSSPNSYHHMTH